MFESREPQRRGRAPQKLEPPIVQGRVPPHDLDAEAAVLSAILLSREALDRVLEVLKPEHFYSDANGRIYDAATQLAVAGTPIDIVSVASYLRDRERLAQVGGPSYLAQLADATPAVAHVGAHAQVVYEKWRLRALIATCQRVAAEGYGDVGDPQSFVDAAEQAVYELARTAQKTTAQPINQVLRAAFQQINDAAARGDRITGISTGFERIDSMTSGLHPGELVIVAARPGMGKCLDASSEILLDDGSVATIEEICRRGRARILTLDADWKTRVTEPSHFVDDGQKPVFRVTTRLGRRVTTTLTHPFLTVRGWKPLSEIRVGDRVGVPRELPVFGDRPLRECEIELLGYLIGDGGLTGGAPTFTNTNPRLLESFTSAVRAFGAVTVRRTEATPSIPAARSARAPSLAVTGDAAYIAEERPRFGRRLRGALARRGVGARKLAGLVEVAPSLVSAWLGGQCVPNREAFDRICTVLEVTAEELVPDGLSAASRRAKNPLVEWLIDLGLWGHGAAEKFVPEPVFTLPRAQLALFLNRLFATDGWATLLASGQAQLGYASVSERLMRQVQHLLLRFGVIASVRARTVGYRGVRRPCFQLDITEATSIRRFAKEIGIFGKEAALEAVVRAISARAPHANRDVIPVEIWERIAELKGAESWASIGRRAGFGEVTNLHVGKRGLSRRRLAAFATALGAPDLSRLATSDVYWDEVVAIEPLGSRQVYDLTVPDTHNFIAEDVCVHNTSFVMNIAANVAAPRTVSVPDPGEPGAGVERQEPGFGVVVFSLEMPREQLGVRLVCSEGRVDVGKVRQGQLQPDDWRKLTDAASWLSTVPIWLDDTPAITLLEVRAKVRRIQAEYDREATSTTPERKVGLVVIDYLQLMKGRDGVNSREQEISEISRGLKQLSKELSVPVIALSQLNRSVETRTTKDKRPMLSDLRECVTGDTLVMLTDGRRAPIRDLVGTTPEVVAMTDGRLVSAVAEKVWLVGRRPVFTVELASGRRVRATGRHRLYGAGGWKRVGELAAGDRVAIARRSPTPPRAARWPEARLALLGQLIGDGSYLSGSPMRYTTASEDNSRLVADAARAEFGAEVKRYAGRGQWHQLLLSGNGDRWHPAGVNRWLRELGIFGQRSHEKRIPAAVFSLADESIAVLLRHLWATDGSISLRRAPSRGASRVFFSTNSEGLAGDVAALLLRLGIVARIRTVHQGAYRPVHSVDVSGRDDQLRFLDVVGAFGPRTAPAAALRALLESRETNTNVDTLPREVFGRVRSVMKVRGISQRAMATRRGTAYGGTAHFRFAPSRATVASYAEILDDPELRAHAESDLFWDRVVAIVPAGEEDVYDLTVPGPSSWLADGIVSHNSGAIEQDADMIIFIYRDEYYNPENTDAKGIAEIIIAKQRNGPTGKVKTRFTASCTRFDNLAPGDYPDMGDDE